MPRGDFEGLRDTVLGGVEAEQNDAVAKRVVAFDDAGDRGLAATLTFDAAHDVAAPFIARGARPKVAILREEGVNGHTELAAAFDRAGFDAFDVHMTDLAAGRRALDAFAGFAAGGGFSYGDVLGGGAGWAKSILHVARTRDQFALEMNEYLQSLSKFGRV